LRRSGTGSLAGYRFAVRLTQKRDLRCISITAPRKMDARPMARATTAAAAHVADASDSTARRQPLIFSRSRNFRSRSDHRCFPHNN